MDGLMFEDSEVGIIAAYRAGMFPVLIPDMIIPHEEVRKLAFREMENLLEVKQFFKAMFENA